MPFDTLVFWILFPFILAIFHFLPRLHRSTFLLIISYLYYATWDVKFIFLLIASTGIDYFASQFASPLQKYFVRKIAVCVSLIGNLGLLAYFKYYWSWENLYEIGLPIGISFYTFQSLSYTLDVYRGRLKPYRNLKQVALFVSFFPQLAAGPIERARQLLPQMSNFDGLKKEHVTGGLWLILLGLFKKIYVAEGLRHPTEHVFNSSEASGSAIVLACLFMVFQVYADFSGYSDMARGMARMFNIKLMINFKPFYFATSPTDFWTRWHISLTTWIRDYAILPLRRIFKGGFNYQVSVLLTFILFGLWHDANWTWILFGLTHGTAVLMQRFFSLPFFKPVLPVWLRKVSGLSFMIILYFLSGLLHQSKDMGQVSDLISQLVHRPFYTIEVITMVVYGSTFLLPLFFYEIIQERTRNYDWIESQNWIFKALFVTTCICGIVIFERATKIGFIYFQF